MKKIPAAFAAIAAAGALSACGPSAEETPAVTVTTTATTTTSATTATGPSSAAKAALPTEAEGDPQGVNAVGDQAEGANNRTVGGQGTLCKDGAVVSDWAECVFHNTGGSTFTPYVPPPVSLEPQYQPPTYDPSLEGIVGDSNNRYVPSGGGAPELPGDAGANQAGY